MADCLFNDPLVEWDSIVSWFVATMRGKSIRATLCRLCFGASVYHLWRHRNDLLHGNILKSEDALVVQIKWDVRSRMLTKCSAKKIVHSLELVDRWNLHPLLHL